MLAYLSADIICSEKRTIFRECSLWQPEENCECRGTDNVQGQVSEYIFAQMEAIVFILLQIFFGMHTVLKIGEYSWLFPTGEYSVT